MPQMAPMNWFILMTFFITIYFMYNTINYFIFSYPNTHKSSKKNSKNTINWKW